VKPSLERQIVTVAAEKGHCAMAMGIVKCREHKVSVALNNSVDLLGGDILSDICDDFVLN
jgi:hypothetical protein